jgi:hypothetical protein
MNAQEEASKTFGIRVSLPAGDPFTYLLDEDWAATHWFETPTARDLALQDMQREHEYSRNGDKPALVFEAIQRSHS